MDLADEKARLLTQLALRPTFKTYQSLLSLVEKIYEKGDRAAMVMVILLESTLSGCKGSDLIRATDQAVAADEFKDMDEKTAITLLKIAELALESRGRCASQEEHKLKA